MKHRITLILLSFVLVAAVASCAADKDTRLSVDPAGKTVVERYGQLQVIGTNLCDQAGKPVQLRGMSSHGLQWYGKYANKDVLTWLRNDWNAQIWRSAMYLTQGGYINAPVLKNKVIESVDAAIDLGIYVVIDWHVMNDRNPQAYQAQSIEFFREMATKYGDKPNVIYEICNEPNGKDVTWSGNIKPYAEAVIAAIRAIDPDNIIIVGTPSWSQDVDIAAADPIVDQKNIMYTLHFYAGSHGKALMNKADIALSKGLPLFVTECGTSEASGGGGTFIKESIEWLSFLEKRNISWINWSVNNKGEESGVLVFNADRDAKGGWKDSDLTQSGRFIRKVMRNEIKVGGIAGLIAERLIARVH
ncbi:MAG TPA: glycoside hydrolase family 5 protein [Treponemataceae bacterium]|nr:glycoside hydrolase family 5 protein [Treponemataceae bacterium]HPS43352.1 glycoside hydrolase family 5 protein [Treponemataceae bacterium]